MPVYPRWPAVFLDRDGVINENRDDYVKSIGEVRLIPGVLPAFARLARLDCRIVIVTNQSAVGRGLVPWYVSESINQHIVQQVTAAGGRIDGVYICPHLPEAGCPCRKPRPGLLLNAAAALNIDLAASVIIGDSLTDVLAGLAAGAQAMLVRTGRGAEQALELETAGLSRIPVADDLPAALADLETRLPWRTKTPPSAGGATNQTTAEILP